jgi:hypothetical protein
MFGLAAARHEPSIDIDRATSAINAKLRDGPFRTDGKRVKVRAAGMGRNRLTRRKDESRTETTADVVFPLCFPLHRSQFGHETFAYLNKISTQENLV